MIGYPKHYRIWNGEKKEWVRDAFVDQNGWITNYKCDDLSNHTVEYYHNYKDKNGKPIAEGDIVLTDEAGWVAQVIFDGDSFCCVTKEGWSMMCNWPSFEVLGNIHENPELIKCGVIEFGKERIERLIEVSKMEDHTNPKTLADELNEGDIYLLAESKGYPRLTIKRTGECNYTIYLEDEARTKEKHFTKSTHKELVKAAREFLVGEPFTFASRPELPHTPTDERK